MMIDGIKNGIVIDHIQGGKSIEIYLKLHLDELDCSVAILRNVRSKRKGKKDLIKIDRLIELNMDILGYIDPSMTVNIVKDGRVVEKLNPKPPKILRDVVKCENPHCITSSERNAEHAFKLVDEQKHIYRCIYCEADAPKFL